MSTEPITPSTGDTFRIDVRDQRPLFKITRIDGTHVLAVGLPDPSTHAPGRAHSIYNGAMMNFLLDEVTAEMTLEAQARAFFEQDMLEDETKFDLPPEKWDHLTETAQAIYRLAVQRGDHLKAPATQTLA